MDVPQDILGYTLFYLAYKSGSTKNYARSIRIYQNLSLKTKEGDTKDF